MGKNKKPKTIGQLLIDLTPLLDVIFIVLIVVLVGRDSYNAEADKKYADAEQYVSEADAKVAEMEAKTATYTEQMKAYGEISEYVNLITVYAGYNPANRKFRTIYVMINADAPKEINLNPSTEKNAWAECRTMIEEVIQKNENAHAVLSISTENSEQMLYRDEEAIYDMFKDLMDKYSNISMR